jgi:hypothetical protein
VSENDVFNASVASQPVALAVLVLHLDRGGINPPLQLGLRGLELGSVSRLKKSVFRLPPHILHASLRGHL